MISSRNWIYETGVETPEILGSGSNYNYVFETKDFDEALEESKRLGRNYLTRKIFKDGRIIREEYDFDKKEFIKY